MLEQLITVLNIVCNVSSKSECIDPVHAFAILQTELQASLSIDYADQLYDRLFNIF